MSMIASSKSEHGTPSKSSAHAKTVSLSVGGVLIIIAALVCLFFAAAWSIWPPLGMLIFHEALVSPTEQILVGTPGILAFALGLTAGITSLLRRHFSLAKASGGLFLIPAAWVLFTSSVVLSFRSSYYPIGLVVFVPLLMILFALAIVGLILVAKSRREFS